MLLSRTVLVVSLTLTVTGLAATVASAQAGSTDPDLTRRREARMARDMARGRAFMEAGQSALAQRHFEDALRANPSAAEPYLELGRALLASGRTADAILVFEAGRARSPENTSLVAALADALFASGRGTQALGVLRQASRRHRSHDELHSRRGVLALTLGAWLEAADAFAAVLDLAENGHPVPADRVQQAESSLRAIGILVGERHPRTAACDPASASPTHRWRRALAACRP